MERKDFLRLLGTAGLGVCASCALQSCSDSSDPAPSAAVDFTLDLNDSANADLGTDGGFVYKNGIIVVCLSTMASSFTAVSQTCTHQGTRIGFDAANGNFLCPNHGSRFSPTGSVLNGPATVALRRYNTTLTGTELRVFS